MPSATIQKKIEKRAYEHYLKRNGHPGDPMRDWLNAELEVMKEESKKKPATPKKKVPSKK